MLPFQSLLSYEHFVYPEVLLRVFVVLFITLHFSFLLGACSLETYLLVDTITFSPQPIKVQAGSQAETNIEFQIKRSNGDCLITDKGSIELELLTADKKLPITWLTNNQFLPNPISFSGQVRQKKKCFVEASLIFSTIENAPLGLQRLKVFLKVLSLGKQADQYVDLLVEIVP